MTDSNEFFKIVDSINKEYLEKESREELIISLTAENKRLRDCLACLVGHIYKDMELSHKTLNIIDGILKNKKGV